MLQTINGIDLLIAIVGIVISFATYRQGENIGYWAGYEQGYEAGRTVESWAWDPAAVQALPDATVLRLVRPTPLYDWEVDGL